MNKGIIMDRRAPAGFATTTTGGFRRFLTLRIAAGRAERKEDFQRFAAVYDTMKRKAVAADMDCRAPAGSQ